MEVLQSLNLGLHGDKSRVVWHPGTIQPYSSLWITVQRLLVLNQPTPRAFMQDFLVSSSRKTLNKLSLDSNGTQDSDCPLRLVRLARVLHEPIERFACSYIGQFPQTTWPLFRNFASCPICLSEGFHSVLFNLDGLTNCPVHHVRLRHFICCPDKKGSNGLEPSDFSAPGLCTCGKRFLGYREARAPTVNQERDKALGEVAKWLQTIGSRCWFGLNYPQPYHPQTEKLTRNFLKLKEPLRLPDPVEWWPPTQGLENIIINSMQVVIFGGAKMHIDIRENFNSEIENLKFLFHNKNGDFYEYQSELVSDFKSIRRYLLNHTVRNGRKWIEQFAMANDTDSITRMIEGDSGSDDAKKSWALLIWWQACVWSLNLRDWFRKREYILPIFHDVPTIMKYRNRVNLSNSETAQEWIVRWLNVESLFSLWQVATTQTADINFPKYVIWGKGVLGRGSSPDCSIGLTEDGRLLLCIDRQTGPMWVAATRKDKSERQERFQAQLIQRFSQVQSTCVQSCIWYHSSTTEWCAGPGPVPTNLADCRRHHLFPPRNQTKFVVFPNSQAEDDRRAYVARCLEHPVAATGVSPRCAIRGLRFALERYQSTLH